LRGRVREGGRVHHKPDFWPASSFFTSATTSSLATSNCPGRSARQARLSAIAAASALPATRSFTCSLPESNSFEPAMMATGEFLRSAYFNCAFMPDAPRYISAATPAFLRSDDLLVVGETALIHHGH